MGVQSHAALTLRSRRSVVGNAVASHSVWELRRPLKVQFVGELGEDAGGLTSEFFELAFQELAAPQYQLWEVRRDWRTLWFSSLPVDPSKESLYEIVGRLLGMCVYNSSSVALNFPSWLYAQLLGITPTLQDLKALDPTLARSLEELLRFSGDIENRSRSSPLRILCRWKPSELYLLRRPEHTAWLRFPDACRQPRGLCEF